MEQGGYLEPVDLSVEEVMAQVYNVPLQVCERPSQEITRGVESAFELDGIGPREGEAVVGDVYEDHIRIVPPRACLKTSREGSREFVVVHIANCTKNMVRKRSEEGKKKPPKTNKGQKVRKILTDLKEHLP